MTFEEAVLVFTLEVTKAAKKLDLGSPPPVRVVSFDEAMAADPMLNPMTLAYVNPRSPEPIVYILNWALWHGGKDGQVASQEFLRCVARHEVAHVKVGHLDPGHIATGDLLWRTWRQTVSCDLFK